MISADFMELEEVVQLCTTYLVQELEPVNAVGIFRFAAAHNCSSLARSSLAFVHEHFVEVSKGEEFRDAPRDLIVELLGSECLRVDSEYQVSARERPIIVHFRATPSSSVLISLLAMDGGFLTGSRNVSALH